MSEERLKHIEMLKEMRFESNHDEEVDAINAAIKALEENTRHTEEKSDWISVETRLPEDAGRITVWDCAFKTSREFYWAPKFKAKILREFFGYTHWMPLPEGPK